MFASAGILIKYTTIRKLLAARHHGRELVYSLEEFPNGQVGLLRVHAEVRI